MSEQESREPIRSDMIDFPTGWRLAAETVLEDHHEECSYRTTDRAVLCDCNALALQWRKHCPDADWRRYLTHDTGHPQSE